MNFSTFQFSKIVWIAEGFRKIARILSWNECSWPKRHENHEIIFGKIWKLRHCFSKISPRMSKPSSFDWAKSFMELAARVSHSKTISQPGYLRRKTFNTVFRCAPLKIDGQLTHNADVSIPASVTLKQANITFYWMATPLVCCAKLFPTFLPFHCIRNIIHRWTSFSLWYEKFHVSPQTTGGNAKCNANTKRTHTHTRTHKYGIFHRCSAGVSTVRAHCETSHQ